MQIIACNQTVLALRLPPCTDPAGYTATLSRENRPLYVLARFVPEPPPPGEPEPPPDPNSYFMLPDPLPARGVWSLSLKSSCGCYSTPLYFATCAPPALPGTLLPTRDTPTPVPVRCVPALQPDLETFPVVLGFVFARDQTHTGVDLQADPPLGGVLTPAPAYTALAITADDQALVGGFSPWPIDAPTAWSLRDRHGRELAQGLLTTADGLASFAAALLAPLDCGDHYLILEDASP